MADEAPPSQAKVVAALLAVYIIWGSTYLGIRIVVETIPPFLSAGFRFVLAGGIIYALARGRGAKAPTRAEWKPAAIAGGLLLVGGNGIVSWSEMRVHSEFAALIVATVPLWVVAFEWVWLRRTPSWGVALGVGLGIAGVALLIDPSRSGADAIDPVGAVALLCASAIWSVGTLYSGRAKLPEPPLLAIGMEMTAGGALLVVTGLLLGEGQQLNVAGISQSSAIAFVYLVLIGALIGFTAYLWLVRKVPPALATTYAFVNPIIAIMLGAMILAEPVTDRTLLAAAVIIAAVAIITQAKARPAPDARAPGAPVPPTAEEGVPEPTAKAGP
jgi:drug/metabolite transporter (DMT)-like permease